MYKKAIVLVLVVLSSFKLPAQAHIVNDFVRYTFTAYVDEDKGYDLATADQIPFTEHKSLDLGFYRGALWVRLEIVNTGEAQHCVIYNNDLVNRTYTINQLDPATNKIIPNDQTHTVKYGDERFFNTQQPNFNIQLQEHSTSVFLIYGTSDGRVLMGDPFVVTLEDFMSMVTFRDIENGVFSGAVLIILLINLFYWKNLHRKIYLKYSVFILSTWLLSIGIGGYFYTWINNDLLVDHLIFSILNTWAISWILFTADLFQIKKTSPLLSNIIHITSITIISGLMIYEFAFYKDSVQHLHQIEYLLVPLWIIFIILTLIKARKERLTETKYYLVALGGFIVCTIISFISMQGGFIPVHSVTFIKIGTIIELSVFTYTVAHVLVRKEKELLLVKEKIRQISERYQSDIDQLELASSQLEKENMDMKSTLEQLDQVKDNANTELISVLKLVEMNAKSEEEWILFKEKYKSLNPLFFSDLITSFPNLTKSEIRLLVLYKIGFSQKEISDIVGIAPDSVKKSKQRLRKKLKLSTDDSIHEFIEQF